MTRLGFIGLGAMGTPKGLGREDDSGVIRLLEGNKDRGSDAG
jgi:hypothetical protein